MSHSYLTFIRNRSPETACRYNILATYPHPKSTVLVADSVCTYSATVLILRFDRSIHRLDDGLAIADMLNIADQATVDLQNIGFEFDDVVVVTESAPEIIDGDFDAPSCPKHVKTGFEPDHVSFLT